MRTWITLSLMFVMPYASAQVITPPIKPSTGWQPIGAATAPCRGHTCAKSFSYVWFLDKEPGDYVQLCYRQSRIGSTVTCHSPVRIKPGARWHLAGVSADSDGNDSSTWTTAWFTDGKQVTLCEAYEAAPPTCIAKPVDMKPLP